MVEHYKVWSKSTFNCIYEEYSDILTNSDIFYDIFFEEVYFFT